MNTNLCKVAIAALALAAFMAPMTANAQQTTPMHPKAGLQQRIANQRARIHKGVANGTLTHRQAMNMQAHDTMLSKRIASDKAANGGHLTPAERARLTHRVNRFSNHIYKKKH